MRLCVNNGRVVSVISGIDYVSYEQEARQIAFSKNNDRMKFIPNISEDKGISIMQELTQKGYAVISLLSECTLD